ncbi:MAG: hypothetical protein JWO35_903 [Candidatus Saccharibacteria bacterium]|nr:hypothetical protein [Candidatus Saccharibacteria bacterium]
MFGQQNNQPANDQIPDQSIDGVLSDVVAPDPAAVAAPAPTDDTPQEDWQHPGMPLDADKAAVVQPAVPKPVYTDDNKDESTFAANDLIDIKQKALSQLSPLVGHLDQSPEEKFRTTMMMIQASDDQTLVKTAHEAAMQIEDEKIRAQALLDIVNEINYFTAHHPEA